MDRILNSRTLWSYLAAILLIAITTKCTTQDFEYAGKSHAVYRLKIENLGDTDVTYTPMVSFYYISGKDSLPDLQESRTIAPSDPQQLVVESKEGVYGASIVAKIKKPHSKIRLTLEKGTGTDEEFALDSVVAEKIGIFSQTIRYGDWY